MLAAVGTRKLVSDKSMPPPESAPLADWRTAGGTAPPSDLRSLEVSSPGGWGETRVRALGEVVVVM